MMRGKSMGLVAVVVAVTAVFALAQDRNQRDSLRRFMRPKLEHAQNLLEGLTLEDFDQIAKEAQALSLLSREAEWQVFQTEDYLHYSFEFRRATESLRTAATKKNLDGAALAYVDMTMKCISCHKYVRDMRTAKASQPNSAR